MVTLENESSADILGTSDPVEGSGGIWEIRLGYTSSLYMAGGQVNEITIGNGNATARLTGGLMLHRKR